MKIKNTRFVHGLIQVHENTWLADEKVKQLFCSEATQDL